MKTKGLKEVVQFNNSFKTAVNLYLSLNKPEKVSSYIPTKSSVVFLKDYLQAVIGKKEQATLLIGPYGKGKSHLLLVLLAILSMERTKENGRIIEKLCKSIEKIDDESKDVAEYIQIIWGHGRFLPIIINDTHGDLNQSFLTALNDALKRDGLSDLAPDTYYSIALDRIGEWEKEYKTTYDQFVNELSKHGVDLKEIKSGLKLCKKEALDVFIDVYPKVTAGSAFNPLAESDVLPLYKGISERLVEEKGYEGLYIVFDEFSKFIEGLNGNSLGNNMKLLQDICELSTESTSSQIYITMVAHKSIKEYGKYLSTEIINAFTGIEGRIIEKYFVTSSKNNYELVRHAIIKDESKIKEIKEIGELTSKEALENYYRLPIFCGQFEKKYFDQIILKGCYPLNPIATYLLLNISEKVAQNERTLFTFISNDEPNSLARYVDEHDSSMDWGVGADLIYDYFKGLFKKDVTNELVHNTWLSAETALAKCQNEDEKKIVKAIAIIQIVNKPEEVVATDNYICLAARVADANAFDDLKQRKVIYVKGSTGAYVFKTKAGTELRTEIKKQKEIKGDNVDYPGALERITDNHYVLPRKYNNLNEMTRYFSFEFMDVETFLEISDPRVFDETSQKADGVVLCLYSFSTVKQSEVKKHFKELSRSDLIVIAPKRKLSVANQLKEYDVLQDIKEDQSFITNNEVLEKEIPLLEEDIETVVKEQYSQIYVDDPDCLVLMFEGDRITNVGVGNVESAVNACCERVYYKSPLINNEIVNRSAINTGQTRKARINIISEILKTNGIVEEDYYEGTNQEATVFRSLFVRTGVIDGNTDENLSEILRIIDRFINLCCDKKQSFKKLIDEITSEPFGMRLGVIPLYLAYKMAQRNEDLVVYYADGEVQLTPEIIVNACEDASNYSLFVPKESKEREDYIESLNNLFSVQENRNLTDNRIKNIVICMQRWFRSLPQVSRNAADIDRYTSSTTVGRLLTIKETLQQVEINPYEILFIEIPNAFGSKTFNNTYKRIKECKEFYDDYYEMTVGAASDCIRKAFGDKRNKDLFHILKEWYENQSSLSKQGLHSGKVTNLMSCVEKLDVYDDSEVTKKVVKAVTDVYIDNWTDGSIDEFEEKLSYTKNEIECIRQEGSGSQHKLSFTGKTGDLIEKYYETVDEGTGSVLRNILEDTLEEFDDLSVNDRVGILLEMIERIIG